MWRNRISKLEITNPFAFLAWSVPLIYVIIYCFCCCCWCCCLTLLLLLLLLLLLPLILSPACISIDTNTFPTYNQTCIPRNNLFYRRGTLSRVEWVESRLRTQSQQVPHASTRTCQRWAVSKQKQTNKQNKNKTELEFHALSNHWKTKYLLPSLASFFSCRSR